MSNQRDTTWDAIKGIGIILMVVGHSGCPMYIRNFIYLFHMGLFFYISGKFLKVNRGGQIIDFLKRKVKGLYKPFVVWSIIFTVLHNLFYKFGWYNDIYSIKQLVWSVVKVFAFKDVSENLIGPIWFLKSLFFGSVLTYIICLIPKRSVQMFIVIILYVVSWYLGEHYLPYLINREIGIVIAIYLGFLLKDWVPVCNKLHLILLILILSFSAFFVKIDVVGCIWGPLGALPILTLLGVVFMFNIVTFIKNKFDIVFNGLSYLGKQSIYILILHWTAFHILSSILVSCGIGRADSLTNTTVLSDLNSNIWFLPYSLLGILVPLIYPVLKHKITTIINSKNT